MSADIAAVEIAGDIFRVGRAPDAFALAPWEFANSEDGTFGGRYDDPAGQYRVLYVARSRVGAFVEKLAPLRPSLADLRAVAERATPSQRAELPSGGLPEGWSDRRVIGRARVEGPFVDIGNSSTIRWLRSRLADTAVAHGLTELDAATIRLSSPRGLTQAISRLLYERETEGGTRFEGIAFRSRLGDELENLAIFERGHSEPAVVDPSSETIDPADADLLAALARLGFAPG